MSENCLDAICAEDPDAINSIRLYSLALDSSMDQRIADAPGPADRRTVHTSSMAALAQQDAGTAAAVAVVSTSNVRAPTTSVGDGPGGRAQISTDMSGMDFSVVAGDSSAVATTTTTGAVSHAQEELALTPLGLAVAVGHADVAALLLKKGADPNACHGSAGTLAAAPPGFGQCRRHLRSPSPPLLMPPFIAKYRCLPPLLLAARLANAGSATARAGRVRVMRELLRLSSPGPTLEKDEVRDPAATMAPMVKLAERQPLDATVRELVVSVGGTGCGVRGERGVLDMLEEAGGDHAVEMLHLLHQAEADKRIDALSDRHGPWRRGTASRRR